MDDPNPALDQIVQRRLQSAQIEIRNSVTHIANGNPLAAEPDQQRRVNRLQSKAALTKSEAEVVSIGIDALTERRDLTPMMDGKEAGPEAIIATMDFVGVSFLERGRRAADAVARVAFANGNPQGSGFVVAPGLFLTNHHVVSSPADAARFCIEFDYEFDISNSLRTLTKFTFDPARCFVTDTIDGLDYTLIGIGARIAGPRMADGYGYIPLSDAKDKHMLGEIANIIQHPRGRYKEVVLRENRLVARDETMQVLHYIADTEPGSSGSPVFNNDWVAIALHHWGGPYREVKTPDGRPLNRDINEGIRVSAIVKDLRRRVTGLGGGHRDAVARALRLRDSLSRPVPAEHADRRHEAAAPAAGARQNSDGSVTWTFPIEINVRAPLLSNGQPSLPEPPPVAPLSPAEIGLAEAATWKTEDFSDREGYEPGFISGFTIPLPKLTRVKHRPAGSRARR